MHELAHGKHYTSLANLKWLLFTQKLCGFKSWAIKKTEYQRIDAFELWCRRRLLGVPWTARRSNQPILKEIKPEYSLEGLMLKLKLRYFGHLMWRADSLEKILLLEKFEGRRRRGQQRMRWLDSITNPMAMKLSKMWDIMKDREAWLTAVHEVIKSRTWLGNWTTTIFPNPVNCQTEMFLFSYGIVGIFFSFFGGVVIFID